MFIDGGSLTILMSTLFNKLGGNRAQEIGFPFYAHYFVFRSKV